MNSFDSALHQQLEALRAAGLLRELRRLNSPQGPEVTDAGESGGRTLTNFSSNDYLGLSQHPSLIEAAVRATERFGAGSGAARLICGSLAPHHQLEETLAAFKGVEAALSFSSGYATALGVIGALLDKNDVIIIDKLVHASIVDAARLCGATLRVFDHNDLNDLEKILAWADRKFRTPPSALRPPRLLVVTESVFSMDGDLAPIRDLVELKDRHGAWLMVDEAHATGLYGEQRRGLIEEHGVGGRVEIQMGTLGKALGAAGGYIAGSRALIDLLINRARSFIFSTAPAPGVAAAATAAVGLVQSAAGEELRRRCWSNVDAVKNAVIRAGHILPPVQSAILPIQIGDERKALAFSALLREQGLLIPAIRYPTVARGEARLRLTVTAAHLPEHIARLEAALRSEI